MAAPGRHMPVICKIALGEDAQIPIKCTKNSAGYDLASTENYLLCPGERAKIPTGVCLVCPPGYYARIADKSSNAYKTGIFVVGGVIDPDYRSQIYVVLWNSNNIHSVFVPKGGLVAQIIFERFTPVTFWVTNSLEKTERGSKGFGEATHGKAHTDETISGEVDISERIECDL